MKKEWLPQELVPTPLTVHLKAHIVRDLKKMTDNMKIPIDDLVTTALLMFIATHGDYLNKNKPGAGYG